jgi:hypothetical protein
MNKFFIASALTIASLAATVLPSQAASIVLVNDDGPYYHRHHHHDRGDWNDHRRHCFTKVVKGWHHGRRVVTEERVCR